MVKNSSKLKVLIVEDSKVAAETISGYLEHMEIRQPFMAETGQMAIDLFKQHRPDIILLDVILPSKITFSVVSLPPVLLTMVAPSTSIFLQPIVITRAAKAINEKRFILMFLVFYFI